MEELIQKAIDRVNTKQLLLPGKWTKHRQREMLIHFCVENGVVPALALSHNQCLCPVIKGGVRQWKYTCENDPNSLVGFDVLDHLVFFKDINSPKKIFLAVSQPYFQTLDESVFWKETLTQWGQAKGLRIVLSNGPGVSWWNPGEGENPHLGHCIKVEFWNDSERGK